MFMSMFKGQPPKSKSRSKTVAAIPKAQADNVVRSLKMEYVREWFCSARAIQTDGTRATCNARLKIRARDDRPEGGALPSWTALAIERGWQVDPVVCPACQAGLSREEYREMKRRGNG